MTKNQRANLHARIAADVALAVKAQCGELFKYGCDAAAAQALTKVANDCGREITATLLRHYTIRDRRRA